MTYFASKIESWSPHPKVGTWRLLNSLFSCNSHSTNNLLTVLTTGDDAILKKSFDPIIISNICSPSLIWEMKVSCTNISLSNGTGNSILSEPQNRIQIQSYKGLQQTHSSPSGTSFTILPHSNFDQKQILCYQYYSSFFFTVYCIQYSLSSITSTLSELHIILNAC